MFYRVTVCFALLFFSLSLFTSAISVWMIIQSPKYFAIHIPQFLMTLLLAPAAFPVVRYFRFRRQELAFLPSEFVNQEKRSFKAAKYLAWTGHLFFAYAIFLRLFTYQYAGAFSIPLLLYIIVICTMERTITNWRKSRTSVNA